MGGKLFLALCALVCCGQVSPHALTKEIKLAPKTDLQISYQTFLDAAAALGDVNVRKELMQLFFKTPEQAVLNLADLLNRTSHPQVDEVLGVFNAGLGTRLLTINEEYVQVDANAFEKLLSQNAVSLARVLYSKDYFRQLVALGMFQRTIKKVVPELRPVIDASKVSVKRFETALAYNNNADGIGNRALGGIQGRSLFSDLLDNVQLTLCDSVVTILYTRFNTALSSFVSFLDAIDVSSSDNTVVNLLAVTITFLVDLAKDLIVNIDDLVESLVGNLCSDLISSSSNSTSSRRRRDVTALREDLNRSNALAPSFERGVATRGIIDGIWTLIWGLISSVMNTSLTTLVASALTSLQSLVDSLIQDVLGEWIYSVINSIFVVS